MTVPSLFLIALLASLDTEGNCAVAILCIVNSELCVRSTFSFFPRHTCRRYSRITTLTQSLRLRWACSSIARAAAFIADFRSLLNDPPTGISTPPHFAGRSRSPGMTGLDDPARLSSHQRIVEGTLI